MTHRDGFSAELGYAIDELRAQGITRPGRDGRFHTDVKEAKDIGIKDDVVEAIVLAEASVNRMLDRGVLNASARHSVTGLTTYVRPTL